LRRTPAITLAALITLAIGIGANTAVFGVVDGLLLRPLPYPDPGRLGLICIHSPGIGIFRTGHHRVISSTSRRRTGRSKTSPSSMAARGR